MAGQTLFDANTEALQAIHELSHATIGKARSGWALTVFLRSLMCIIVTHPFCIKRGVILQY